MALKKLAHVISPDFVNYEFLFCMITLKYMTFIGLKKNERTDFYLEENIINNQHQ